MRGATGHFLAVDRVGVRISIHAPRAGRDLSKLAALLDEWTFQSTRPVRGATPVQHFRDDGTRISIHAPRAGRDE